MKKAESSEPSPRRARTDWRRVRRAVSYLEFVLGCRFHGNGLQLNPLNPGWLRSRLRELLEAFPTPIDAEIWVHAAAFKAQSKERPMPYFALLVNQTLLDPSMLHPSNMLSPGEHRAWLAATGLEWRPDHRDPCGPR